ncbi:MAG: hypothetical protein JWM32_338 [Verrucomicrobia bacterium]|nr:hypothetical protein [Verrucomicrobiota bacterium]
MSLDRFKKAQEGKFAGYATALAELRAGRKTSHWIWYIFPQLAGLGHSSTARHYALKDLDEACDYLRDPLLRERLQTATQAVADKLAKDARITDLMGSSIDALKLVSSLTLCEIAARRLANSEAEQSFAALEKLCRQVLDAARPQGLERCQFTLDSIGNAPRAPGHE